MSDGIFGRKKRGTMDGKMAAEGNAEAVAGESVATACDGSKCNFVQVVGDKIICRQSGSAFSYSCPPFSLARNIINKWFLHLSGIYCPSHTRQYVPYSRYIPCNSDRNFRLTAVPNLSRRSIVPSFRLSYENLPFDFGFQRIEYAPGSN